MNKLRCYPWIFIPASRLEPVVIFYNGKILSPNRHYTWMEVSGGKISNLGTGVPPGSGIDLGGKVVLPGFHDSHIHIFSLGRAAQRLNLVGSDSIAELKKRLQEYSQTSKSDWIVGYGWNQDMMVDGRYPCKDDIDEVISDRPVVLFRACHHIGLVNSKGLDILGIDSSSTSPEGGVIDFENGVPTGILREKALSMVTEHIQSASSVEERMRIIQRGIEECLKVGITSVQTNDPIAWEAYCQLDDEGKLPISVHLTFPVKEVLNGSVPEPGAVHGNVVASRVKLFADGSLGASTAALNESYSDGTDTGVLIYSDEELEGLVSDLAQKGWRIEIHAIGDRAAEQVIRAFKKHPSVRPVLTHAQVLSASAIEELSNSDIIANIQPVFLGTDKTFADARLGERVKYAYAWKTLIDNGILVAGGSDAPIESPNPLLGMYQAIYRRKNEEDTPWRPEESLKFKEALELFTTRGAYASMTDGRSGALEIGMDADFIVLSEDVLEDPRKLLTAKVLEVYKSGLRIHSLEE